MYADLIAPVESTAMAVGLLRSVIVQESSASRSGLTPVASGSIVVMEVQP
jgi:hypothetical protein